MTVLIKKYVGNLLVKDGILHLRRML